MDPNFYVVLIDNNPANPANAIAFFRSQAEATAWRDANHPGAGVQPAVLSTFLQQYPL